MPEFRPLLARLKSPPMQVRGRALVLLATAACLLPLLLQLPRELGIGFGVAAVLVAAVSWRTGSAVALSNSSVARANSSFRWSFSSVIVPTVEREVRTGLVWSIAIAGGMPSTRSTLGLSMRSRNCRAYGENVST